MNSVVRKVAVVAAALGLVIMLAGSQVKPSHLVSKPNGKHDAIVRLTLTGPDGSNHSFCSGAVITPQYILTAAHCVRGFLENSPQGATIDIRNNDGKDLKVQAIPIAANGRADLAILIGNFRSFNLLKLSKGAHRTMENFLSNKRLTSACGFPWGAELVCVKLADKHFTLFAQAVPGVEARSGWLLPGMSGGPVIDMETNEVIGVNTGMDNGAVFFAPAVGMNSMFNIPIEDL